MSKPWREVLTEEMQACLRAVDGSRDQSAMLKKIGDSVAKALRSAADEADALLAENARLKEELAEAKQERTCEWTLDSGGEWWDSGCGVKGNSDCCAKFCEYCCGKVVVK